MLKLFQIIKNIVNMNTINRDRDMIISKNIYISNCSFEQDVIEATDWLMKWIESDDFQS